jgi:hypothetical protein
MAESEKGESFCSSGMEGDKVEEGEERAEGRSLCWDAARRSDLSRQERTSLRRRRFAVSVASTLHQIRSEGGMGRWMNEMITHTARGPRSRISGERTKNLAPTLLHFNPSLRAEHLSRTKREMERG